MISSVPPSEILEEIKAYMGLSHQNRVVTALIEVNGLSYLSMQIEQLWKTNGIGKLLC